MNEKVVYTPQPRYVVQIGEAEAVGRTKEGATLAEVSSWAFHSAYFDQKGAQSEAILLSMENEHVRVVDRGENDG